MESLKAFFVKPTPQEQLRDCNKILRKNIRDVNLDILRVKQVEIKTKNLIKEADKRGQRNPARAKQAAQEVRGYARELLRTRRTLQRLETSKALLGSVQMQVTNAFNMRKIQGSLQESAGIMRDVNSLIKLPAMAGTMRELSVELMKAGIIEEMVGEALPEDEEDLFEEEEEAESEVDKVLSEILKDRMGPAKMPAVPVAPQKEQRPAVPVAAEAEEEEEEDTAAMMDEMRSRLQALRS